MSRRQFSILSTEQPKRLSRKDYPVITAVDPRDGGEWDLLLPPSLLQEALDRGSGRANELAFTLRDAVRNIRHIFLGVRDTDNQDGCDDWLAYISTPAWAYDLKTGERRRAWKEEVFAVYVTDEREVINFFWIDCDPHDKTLPIDHETRFIERVF